VTAPRLRALPRPEPIADQATVVHVVGARPNFVKMAPLIEALRRRGAARQVVVHTGQHYDRRMSEEILEDLGFPAPDHSLGIGSGSHGEQTGKVLIAFEQILLEERPGLVVVAGDVNSTLACALAAAKLHIPIAHLEAGLRSFDNKMPEEHNRLLTDHLSSVLLVHSESALDNLAAEGIDLELAHFVGNTMIDSVFAHVDAARAEKPWEELGVQPGEYGLVTLHRPALVDDPALLTATVEGLRGLAATYPIVFPVHPRTRQHLVELGLESGLPEARVLLSPPLGYLAFLGLQAEAGFLLTDSGGVQEETSALGVRCFTLRDSTERPVTVELGTNSVLGARPDRIAEIPSLLAQPQPNREIPLWDGAAGPRAADVLLRAVS
jgi:UDP-N-acetylglucosamine 2-epimerase (non-hydrolysing)